MFSSRATAWVVITLLVGSTSLRTFAVPAASPAPAPTPSATPVPTLTPEPVTIIELPDPGMTICTPSDAQYYGGMSLFDPSPGGALCKPCTPSIQVTEPFPVDDNSALLRVEFQ